MECVGVCSALTLGLSYLGITPCSTHSHPLVAGRQTLVFQYPLAPIPFCFLGHPTISATLDANPEQLAPKGIFSHWLTQFHRRFRSYLIRKGHFRTLFVSSIFPPLLRNSQSRGFFYVGKKLTQQHDKWRLSYA